MHVLVVDDSAEVRARIAALLAELRDVYVREAADAEEALGLAAETTPDVVILDVHMPGKNGLAIVGALKAGSAPPIVVVLTNQPTGQHRREAFARGADFFFDKSTEFTSLVEVVLEPDLARRRHRAARGDGA